MPFGSFESSVQQAFTTAAQFIQVGKMDCVKMEGGVEIADTVKFLTSRGIPVLGHIGLTPQRHLTLGGYKAQGRNLASVQALVRDALALQAAGVWGVVMESIPEPVATHLTSLLHVPTIGIGCGPGTSGQILVQGDMLGIGPPPPKFCRVFADVESESVRGIMEYVRCVKDGSFPSIPDHTYKMERGQESQILEWIKQDGKLNRD